MTQNRRSFLQATLLAALSTQVAPELLGAAASASSVRPRRLVPGATVGLVSPASATWPA